MGDWRKGLVAVVVGGLAAGTAAAQSPASGPVAVYWISASTTTGMGGMGQMSGMGGGGGPPQQQQQQQPRRPGLGSMMGMAVGGGFGLPFGRRDPPPSDQGGGAGAGGYGGGAGRYGGMGGGGASRALTLQLGSTQSPSGPPQAAHFVPAGLGAGGSLPLVTPTVRPPEPAEGGAPQMSPQQRPRGRMLIYWGCGEHAQGPVIIDFAKIGPGQPAPNIPFIAANPGRPPSPGRYATYGAWPNEQSRASIPPGSDRAR